VDKIYFLFLIFNQVIKIFGAKNREKIVPKTIPIIKVKAKYLRVTPPKKKIDTTTIKVVTEVPTDLPIVSYAE
jgi:hypothetical protein